MGSVGAEYEKANSILPSLLMIAKEQAIFLLASTEICIRSTVLVSIGFISISEKRMQIHYSENAEYHQCSFLKSDSTVGLELD